VTQIPRRLASGVGRARGARSVVAIDVRAAAVPVRRVVARRADRLAGRACDRSLDTRSRLRAVGPWRAGRTRAFVADASVARASVRSRAHRRAGHAPVCACRHAPSALRRSAGIARNARVAGAPVPDRRAIGSTLVADASPIVLGVVRRVPRTRDGGVVSLGVVAAIVQSRYRRLGADAVNERDRHDGRTAAKEREGRNRSHSANPQDKDRPCRFGRT
jgi:hypothetical protein